MMNFARRLAQKDAKRLRRILSGMSGRQRADPCGWALMQYAIGENIVYNPDVPKNPELREEQQAMKDAHMSVVDMETVDGDFKGVEKELLMDRMVRTAAARMDVHGKTMYEQQLSKDNKPMYEPTLGKNGELVPIRALGRDGEPVASLASWSELENVSKTLKVRYSSVADGTATRCCSKEEHKDIRTKWKEYCQEGIDHSEKATYLRELKALLQEVDLFDGEIVTLKEDMCEFEQVSKTVLHTGFSVWLKVWYYLPFITLFPAVLMVNTAVDGKLASLGVFIFIMSLWSLGWGYLWLTWDEVKPIETKQFLAELPPTSTYRLMMIAQVKEMFNLIGFAFFPAVPWGQVEEPEEAPEPQSFMLAGFFQFGDVDTDLWIFLGTIALIAGSPFLMYLTRDRGRGPDASKRRSRRNLITSTLFGALAFDFVSKMTSVFSCTNAKVWGPVETDEDPTGENTTGYFCNLNGTGAPEGAACMDNIPTAVCWGDEHLVSYVLPVMLVLAPYYIAVLHFKAESQAKQSVVALDRVCDVVAFQWIVMLATVSSAIGNCFGMGMIIAQQLSVLSQLALLLGLVAPTHRYRVNKLPEFKVVKSTQMDDKCDTKKAALMSAENGQIFGEVIGPPVGAVIGYFLIRLLAATPTGSTLGVLIGGYIGKMESGFPAFFAYMFTVHPAAWKQNFIETFCGCFDKHMKNVEKRQNRLNAAISDYTDAKSDYTKLVDADLRTFGSAIEEVDKWLNKNQAAESAESAAGDGNVQSAKSLPSVASTMSLGDLENEKQEELEEAANIKALMTSIAKVLHSLAHPHTLELLPPSWVPVEGDGKVLFEQMEKTQRVASDAIPTIELDGGGQMTITARSDGSHSSVKLDPDRKATSKDLRILLGCDIEEDSSEPVEKLGTEAGGLDGTPTAGSWSGQIRKAVTLAEPVVEEYIDDNGETKIRTIVTVVEWKREDVDFSKGKLVFIIDGTHWHLQLDATPIRTEKEVLEAIDKAFNEEAKRNHSARYTQNEKNPPQPKWPSRLLKNQLGESYEKNDDREWEFGEGGGKTTVKDFYAKSVPQDPTCAAEFRAAEDELNDALRELAVVVRKSSDYIDSRWLRKDLEEKKTKLLNKKAKMLLKLKEGGDKAKADAKAAAEDLEIEIGNLDKQLSVIDNAPTIDEMMGDVDLDSLDIDSLDLGQLAEDAAKTAATALLEKRKQELQDAKDAKTEKDALAGRGHDDPEPETEPEPEPGPLSEQPGTKTLVVKGEEKQKEEDWRLHFKDACQKVDRAMEWRAASQLPPVQKQMKTKPGDIIQALEIDADGAGTMRVKFKTTDPVKHEDIEVWTSIKDTDGNSLLEERGVPLIRDPEDPDSEVIGTVRYGEIVQSLESWQPRMSIATSSREDDVWLHYVEPSNSEGGWIKDSRYNCPVSLAKTNPAVKERQLLTKLQSRDYSSVLTLNSVRNGGLSLAVFNGCFAAYFIYTTSPPDACPRVDWAPAQRDIERQEAADEANAPAEELDYSLFFIFAIGNALGLFIGLVSHILKKNIWKLLAISGMRNVNGEDVVDEVDYPVIVRRVDAALRQQAKKFKDFKERRKLKGVRGKLALAKDKAEPVHIDLHVSEFEGTRQQMERTTFDMVFKEKSSVRNPLYVDLKRIEIEEPAGLEILEYLNEFHEENDTAGELFFGWSRAGGGPADLGLPVPGWAGLPAFGPFSKLCPKYATWCEFLKGCCFKRCFKKPADWDVENPPKRYGCRRCRRNCKRNCGLWADEQEASCFDVLICADERKTKKDTPTCCMECFGDCGIKKDEFGQPEGVAVDLGDTLGGLRRDTCCWKVLSHAICFKIQKKVTGAWVSKLKGTMTGPPDSMAKLRKLHIESITLEEFERFVPAVFSPHLAIEELDLSGVPMLGSEAHEIIESVGKNMGSSKLHKFEAMSSGDPSSQYVYTLTNHNVDVVDKVIGENEKSLLKRWLSKPDVIPNLDSLDIVVFGKDEEKQAQVQVISIDDQQMLSQENIELVYQAEPDNSMAEALLLATDIRAGRVPEKLKSIEVQSTGYLRGPSPYVLERSDKDLKLVNKNLGICDIALVGAWIVHNDVTELDISDNEYLFQRVEPDYVKKMKKTVAELPERLKKYQDTLAAAKKKALQLGLAGRMKGGVDESVYAKALWHDAADLLAQNQDVAAFAKMQQANDLEPTRLFDDAMNEKPRMAYSKLQQAHALSPWDEKIVAEIRRCKIRLQESVDDWQLAEDIEKKAHRKVLFLDQEARRLAVTKVSGHWGEHQWIAGPWEKMTWVSRLQYVQSDEDALEWIELTKHHGDDVDEADVETKLRSEYSSAQKKQRVLDDEVNDARGWESFCASLRRSKVQEFTAKGIKWGPKHLQMLAEAIVWEEAKTRQGLDSNQSLQTVKVAAVKEPTTVSEDGSLPMIVLDTEATDLNLQKAALSPVEVPLLMAWLKKRGIEASAKTPLTGLDISDNPQLFGIEETAPAMAATDSTEAVPEKTTLLSDVHIKTFRDLCDAAFTSKICNLNLVNTGMGPKATRSLTSRPLFSVLQKLTLSPLGKGKQEGQPINDTDPVPGEQPATQPYTLEVLPTGSEGEHHVDMSNKGIGPADVPVLAAWISRMDSSGPPKKPDVAQEIEDRKAMGMIRFAEIRSIDLSGNKGLFEGSIGRDVFHNMFTRFKRVSSIHTLSLAQSMSMSRGLAWNEPASLAALATHLHPKSTVQYLKQGQGGGDDWRWSSKAKGRTPHSDPIQDVEIEILQCDGLPAADLLGGNDVYATVTFLDCKRLCDEVSDVFHQQGVDDRAIKRVIKEAKASADPSAALIELILDEENDNENERAQRRVQLEAWAPEKFLRKHTSTHQDAGDRTRFSDEKFNWYNLDTDTCCVVEVWDSDEGDLFSSEDDLLGRTTFLLKDVDHKKSSFSRWFELTPPGSKENAVGDETREKSAREKRNARRKRARVQLHVAYTSHSHKQDDTITAERPWSSLRQLTVQSATSDEPWALTRSTVLNFDHHELTHEDAPLISAWMLLCAEGGLSPDDAQGGELRELSMRNNPNLVGRTTVDPDTNEAVETKDVHLEQFGALCKCISMTNLQSIALDDIGMGPQALTIFSDCLPPNLVSLSVDSALIPFKLVVEKTMVLKDFGISKRFAPLIRAWLQKPDVLDVLESVDLDGNLAICGEVDKSGNLLALDGRVDAFKILCDGLAGTNVKKLSVRNIGMGSKSAKLLAKLVETMPLMLVHTSASGQQHSHLGSSMSTSSTSHLPVIWAAASSDDPQNPAIFIQTICELLTTRIAQANEGKDPTPPERAQLASAVQAQAAIAKVFSNHGTVADPVLPHTVSQMVAIKDDLLKLTHVLEDSNHDGKIDESDRYGTGKEYTTRSPGGGRLRVDHWDQWDAGSETRMARAMEASEAEAGAADLDGVALKLGGSGHANVVSYSYHTTVHQNYSLDAWSVGITQQMDLTGRYLSEGDCHVLAAWISKPEIAVSLRSITLSSSGVAGRNVSAAACPRQGYSPEMTTRLVSYTLNKDNCESLLLQNKNLGPADCIILAAWLALDEVKKKVAAVKLNDNPELCTSEIQLDGTALGYNVDGSPKGYTVLAGGFPALCASIRNCSKLEDLNLTASGIRTSDGDLAPTSNRAALEFPAGSPKGCEVMLLAQALNVDDTPLYGALIGLHVDENPTRQDSSGSGAVKHHLDFFAGKFRWNQARGVLSLIHIEAQAKAMRLIAQRKKVGKLSEKILIRTINNAHSKTGRGRNNERIPLYQISSSVSIPGDLGDIPNLEGKENLAETPFGDSFKQQLAETLGGKHISSDDIVITEMRYGSIIVDFHILVPEASHAKITETFTAVITAGTKFEIKDGNQSWSVQCTEANMEPLVVLPSDETMSKKDFERYCAQIKARMSPEDFKEFLVDLAVMPEVAEKSYEKKDYLTDLTTEDLANKIFEDCSEKVKGDDHPQLILQVRRNTQTAVQNRQTDEFSY